MTELSLSFYALAMLCSLAAVAFVALDTTRRGAGAVAIGFVLGAVAARPDRLPDPVWVGAIVAALAAAAVMRPRAGTLAAAAGGVLGGIWISLLQVEGLSMAAAVAVAVASIAVSLFFSRRKPDFAPDVLREEALLVVFVLAVMVAAAPGIAAGWQSAAVLNLQQKEVPSQIVPAWILLLTLGAAAIGGLYTVWMRR